MHWKDEMLMDSPPRPSPLCKSLLVNSHFTTHPGCLQASNAAVNSTLNSFRFKSYHVFIATNNYPTRSDKAYPHPHLCPPLNLPFHLCYTSYYIFYYSSSRWSPIPLLWMHGSNMPLPFYPHLASSLRKRMS